MAIGLAACHNVGYKQSLEKGLTAVNKNDYERALTYFDVALTQKPKDAKAQAYRSQTQAYLHATSQTSNGGPIKALRTLKWGLGVSGGASILTYKLTALQKTIGADVDEYWQLSRAVDSQLKVKNGHYSKTVLAQCKAINWEKKPYLKNLRPRVTKLLTAVKSADKKKRVSAAGAARAEKARQKIAAAQPDQWDLDSLKQVPDWVILASWTSGDTDKAAKQLTDQYSDDSTYDNSDEQASTDTADDSETAESSSTSSDLDEDDADNAVTDAAADSYESEQESTDDADADTANEDDDTTSDSAADDVENAESFNPQLLNQTKLTTQLSA